MKRLSASAATFAALLIGGAAFAEERCPSEAEFEELRATAIALAERPVSDADRGPDTSACEEANAVYWQAVKLGRSEELCHGRKRDEVVDRSDLTRTHSTRIRRATKPRLLMPFEFLYSTAVAIRRNACEDPNVDDGARVTIHPVPAESE